MIVGIRENNLNIKKISVQFHNQFRYKQKFLHCLTRALKKVHRKLHVRMINLSICKTAYYYGVGTDNKMRKNFWKHSTLENTTHLIFISTCTEAIPFVHVNIFPWNMVSGEEALMIFKLKKVSYCLQESNGNRSLGIKTSTLYFKLYNIIVIII